MAAERLDDVDVPPVRACGTLTDPLDDEAGNGESKLPPAYANNAAFWLDFLTLGVFGAALGGFGFCFISAYEHFTDWFQKDFDSNEYPDKHTWDYGDGQYCWIGISAGFGLIVGTLRVLLQFPDVYPDFLLEVQHQKGEWWMAIRVCLLGLVSLMGGLTIGPEAPMGSLGAGMGQLLADKVGSRWGMDPKFAVLAGMAAGMSVLFPSPLFGVLMLVELGVGTWKPEDLWKQVALSAVCACSSFAVYVGCESDGWTYLDPDNGTAAVGLTVGWELWYLAVAVPLGLYSAVIGVIAMVLFKATQKVVLTLKQRCCQRFNKKAVTILFPAIFGAISGGINVLCPLSIGDGSAQMKEIIKDGNKMGAGILIGNAFAKLICLGIAQGSGFVGGFFFPMFYVGSTAGVLAHLAFEPGNYVNCFESNEYWKEHAVVENGTGSACWTMSDSDGLNQHFAALVCLAAVPAAFVPFPFTLVCIAGFMMNLSPYQMTAVFIAVIVSYTSVSGTGMPAKLQQRGKADSTPEPQDSEQDGTLEVEIDATSS